MSGPSGPPTPRQHRELHATLNTIAEQAQLGGRKAAPLGWKDFYKRLLIGTVEVETCNGGMIVEAVSTKSLTSKEFGDFIHQVRAHAATEFGVVFPAWE